LDKEGAIVFNTPSMKIKSAGENLIKLDGGYSSQWRVLKKKDIWKYITDAVLIITSIGMLILTCNQNENKKEIEAIKEEINKLKNR
jgi:hypothetical protein